MLNQVVICGRLTKDPDIRQVEDGKAKVATFSLAVDQDFVSPSGERRTDFIYCEAWRGTADFLSKYFHKGDMMQIVGRLVCNRRKNKEGNMKHSKYFYFTLCLILCVCIFIMLLALGYLGMVFAWLMRFLSGLAAI